MKLIVGLGNPDKNFDGTRHNIGFATLDEIAKSKDLTWVKKDKFKAMAAEGYEGAEKILLIKPLTYYNLSGEAVQAAAHFYKIDLNDILVIHDELALPLGALRTRVGGSDAGNNGLKSIVATIGADFARIRIGIANEFTAKTDAADFVLGHFSHAENQKLEDIKNHAQKFAESFINNNFVRATIS